MIRTEKTDAAESLILALLRREGRIDAAKMEEYRVSKANENESAERLLVRLGLATEPEIAEIYSKHLSIPLHQPCEDEKPSAELGRLLPEKFLREQMIVPTMITGTVMELAIANPNALLVLDEVQLLTGLSVRPVVAQISVLEEQLDALFSNTQEETYPTGSEDFDQNDDDDVEKDEDEVLRIDQPPPPGRDGRMIRLVNQILEQAVRGGASDIHLETFEDSCKIRLRIDGTLQELAPPSRSQFIKIISRFKILAKMDIAEKRLPQDGAIAIRTGERRIDLRVNTVPTVFGEKMVMRLLDKGSIPLQLTNLGLDERQSNDLIEAIHMPHGLMLVTGPTGSGKSTTLYSCLNLLNDPKTNICTVEDPVEYKFAGLNQVQVKSSIGLTFASALRAFLRQDPDVIMVGEIRDQETAQICLRAALTGHFVLSTIHTNDALSAVSRLVDMAIEPFLLASTLRVLEAQRLVRKLCKQCREPYACDYDTAARYGMEVGSQLFQPKGCQACRGVGYRGRVGIFEVVRITPLMAKLIQARTPLPELREAARSEGMKLLVDSALEKVRTGQTSLETALSVTMSEDD